LQDILMSREKNSIYLSQGILFFFFEILETFGHEVFLLGLFGVYFMEMIG
jgi:hypothetical protein